MSFSGVSGSTVSSFKSSCRYESPLLKNVLTTVWQGGGDSVAGEDGASGVGRDTSFNNTHDCVCVGCQSTHVCKPHPNNIEMVQCLLVYACILTLQMDGGNNTLVCGGRRTGGAVVAGGILEPTVGRGWVNQWSLTDLKATNVASLPAEVNKNCVQERKLTNWNCFLSLFQSYCCVILWCLFYSFKKKMFWWWLLPDLA